MCNFFQVLGWMAADFVRWFITDCHWVPGTVSISGAWLMMWLAWKGGAIVGGRDGRKN